MERVWGEGVMDVSMCLTETLGQAQTAMDEVTAGDVRGERLQWLERQLAHIVGQLQALLMDLDAGLSVADLGFFDDEECQEMVADFGRQIANLRGMIQVARQLGR